MNDLDLEELAKISEGSRPKFEDVKEIIAPLVEKLYDLKAKKANANVEIESFKSEKLSPINAEIDEVERKIRMMVDPYVQGDQWKVSFGDIDLVSKKVTNVKILSKDQIITWMEGNEYKDAMTWDINTNRAKSILREEFERKGVQVEGAEYSQFTTIDVK